MTADETRQVVHSLLVAFPNLVDDGERCGDISRRLMAYDLGVAGPAVDEYIGRSDAKWLELPRLMAVVERHHRQAGERLAEENRIRRLLEESKEATQYKTKLERAAELLAEMADEDVLKEAESIRANLPEVVRWWTEKWTPKQWRFRPELRLKVAAMLVD